MTRRWLTRSPRAPEHSTPAARLMAWVDDVQLSNQTGFPHYQKVGELKADIRSLVEQLEVERNRGDLFQEKYEDASASACGYRADRDRLQEQLETKQRELDEEIERAVENGRLAKRLHEQLEALRAAAPE